MAISLFRVGQTETVLIGYSISDGFGGISSSTLTVTVTGVNDAPDSVSRKVLTPAKMAVDDTLAWRCRERRPHLYHRHAASSDYGYLT